MHIYSIGNDTSGNIKVDSVVHRRMTVNTMAKEREQKDKKYAYLLNRE